MDAIRETLAARVAELESELRSYKAAVGGLQDERDALAAQLQGPDGFATWKDAAVEERVRRVAAENREQTLAAHVERLTSLGRELRSEEDAERAAVLAEWFDKTLEKAPTTTSLAHLKAQWQAEWIKSAELQARLVRNFSDHNHVFEAVPLTIICQTEGDSAWTNKQE